MPTWIKAVSMDTLTQKASMEKRDRSDDLHVSAIESQKEVEACDGAPESTEDLLLVEIAKLKEQQKRLYSIVQRLQKGHTECFGPPEGEGASNSVWVEPEKISSDYSYFGSENSLGTISPAPSSLSVTSMSQTDTISSVDGSSESEETDSVMVCPAKEIISSMWDDFSVDSYTSTLPDDSNHRHDPKPAGWRPQITVARPFSMTIREAFKEKKKSRALLLAEEDKRVKEQEEAAECARKFKASPMPVSAYLPLYDIIVAKNEHRRRKGKETCKELLKSQERPFKFEEREKKKKQEQLEAAEKMNQSFFQSEEQQQFHANPVPQYLFDTSIDDKVKEEELYRQIRIKMRAENLLRQSKMPGSMEERAKSQTSTKSSRARSKTAEKSSSFHPEINQAVPNFSSAYVNLQRELSKKKLTNSSTEVKPFLLRTEMIPSRKDRVHQDIMMDEATLPETRWPFVTPRRRVHFAQDRPRSAPGSKPQKTHTTILREEAMKEKLDAVLALEQSAEEKKMAKALHEREMGRELSQKMQDFSSESKSQAMNRNQKYKATKRVDMQRKAEYKETLYDMNQRLEERPFMLQRVSQMNAVRAAEGKYLSALKRAGLSKDEIEDLLAGQETL